MSNSLNLIPGSGKEFRDKEYWDKFFKIRGNKAFEWYGQYENLCDILHKYIKLHEKILVVGCGNSKLSENMYDVGMKNIVNIDLSNVVIQQMSAKNRQRKEMEFLKMDMLQMDFEDSKFDAVIDKGTLDALMSDYTEKVNEDVNKMFSEIDRVLKVGGRYICISLAQEHILHKVLESFKEKGWFIRIHRIDEHDLDFHLPVFVFVFTKMKMTLANPILELKLDLNSEKFLRVNSVEEAQNRIKEYQHYGLTKFYISNKTIDTADDVFVYLYDSNNEKYPRFTIYIVDAPANANKVRMNGVFAVFVVPIGKEIEWLFSTKLGREELTSQAKYQRLAIVHLNRDHHYESLDAIISELSPKVMDLAPKGIPSSYKIPLLSMGPELDVRDVKYKGSSDISGEFFVEDVTPSDLSEPTRRLVFQNITPLIQTEIILKEEPRKGKKKNDKEKKVYSPNYGTFLEDFFAIILAQLYSVKLNQDQHLRILIVGLGGGVLAMYCKNWLKNVEIDAVEIDPKIVSVAKEWFGLKEDQSTRVYVEDGLKFINEAAKNNKKWDVVIIDINANDPTSELWGPTKEFLDQDLLKNCKSIVSDSGMFIMNLLCLSETIRKSVLEKLGSFWPHLYSNKLPKNRNEILFCSNLDKNSLFLKNSFTEKNDNLNSKDGHAMCLLNDVAGTFKEVNNNS
ncbi:unnamed protein product [Brachionus calyciflorus]|uniref:Methyltransferase type 11 domain-containing protein n=1 Tax=Brachionus calyciflorus TaxID=104777 RepID=A0A813WT59_9BILA|nr:unnamed protein product [Brachionus calyciflorus]